MLSRFHAGFFKEVPGLIPGIKSVRVGDGAPGISPVTGGRNLDGKLQEPVELLFAETLQEVDLPVAVDALPGVVQHLAVRM